MQTDEAKRALHFIHRHSCSISMELLEKKGLTDRFVLVYYVTSTVIHGGIIMLRGLLKKDFLLVKDLLLIGLIAEIVLFIGGASFFASQGIFDYIFVFLFFAYMAHVVIFPVVLMVLLRQEEKGQYWLHGTARASKLMFSKLLIALVVTLASLVVVDVLVLISFFIEFPVEFVNSPNQEIPYVEGFLVNGMILLVSFYFTFLGLFFWSVYHSLNVFPALKKVRWVLLIVLYIVMNAIITWIVDQPFIQKLFNSWLIPVEDWLEPMIIGFTITRPPEGIAVWPIIFSLLYIVGLYVISCWLLDRKVEV
ncbi:hypothetical protein CEW92_12765 [Bacillaceae bacterium SAS-127]|nr:hypothetical protein CEW92_12765 [Bacillaceae bacterium SAS-127]